MSKGEEQGNPVDIGVAILGCGRIGRLHADVVDRSVPGARVAAVFDVNHTSSEEVAARTGASATGSVAEAIATEGVNTVAICTPTDTHVEIIEQAAGAGKHILCEKPVALTLQEVDRAAAVVAASGVSFHVGLNRRFDPTHRAVASAVSAGEIGELHLLRITSRDPAPPPIEYVKQSGGLFLDMTIHDFDMARYVAGSEVVEVYASAAARVDPAIGEVGDVDTAVVVLNHQNGVITTIDNSRQALYGYDQRVEAFGSLGAISSENARSDFTLRRTEAGSAFSPPPNFFLDRYMASYEAEWVEFVASIKEGRPAPISMHDGRVCLQLGEAARRSWQEKRPVPVAEVG